jgi:hypothetical protein
MTNLLHSLGYGIGAGLMTILLAGAFYRKLGIDPDREEDIRTLATVTWIVGIITFLITL